MSRECRHWGKIHLTPVLLLLFQRISVGRLRERGNLPQFNPWSVSLPPRSREEGELGKREEEEEEEERLAVWEHR